MKKILDTFFYPLKLYGRIGKKFNGVLGLIILLLALALVSELTGLFGLVIMAWYMVLYLWYKDGKTNAK
jgi:hypothetical protein